MSSASIGCPVFEAVPLEAAGYLATLFFIPGTVNYFFPLLHKSNNSTLKQLLQSWFVLIGPSSYTCMAAVILAAISHQQSHLLSAQHQNFSKKSTVAAARHKRRRRRRRRLARRSRRRRHGNGGGGGLRARFALEPCAHHYILQTLAQWPLAPWSREIWAYSRSCAEQCCTMDEKASELPKS